MAKILNNLFAVNVLIGLAFLLSCQSDQFKYEDNVLSKRQADSGLVFKDPGLENIIIKYNEVKLLFDSLSIYESLEDQKQIIRVKILLAEACRQSGNYIYGLNFLKDIPDDEEHIGSKQMAGVYNGLAAIYYELYIHNRDLSHYLDSALMFANRSLEIAEKSNDHSLKSDAMNIIGATYIHNKKYEKARAILQNAYAVNQSQDAKMNLGILANLAYVNHKLNNYEKAMEYARLCLKNAVDSENLIFTITAIKTMLDVYKVTGDSEMALKMENKLKILESQKDIVLESLALKQLILEEENQTAQRKILGLYHERYYLFRLSVILIVGILVAVIVAVLLIMYLNKKKKVVQQQLNIRERENEINRERVKNLDQEKQLEQLKSERFKLELQVKEQELVFQSLRQANTILLNNSIKEKLAPFTLKLSRKKDREAFTKTLESIYLESKRDPLSDFEKMFVQMHGGFYEKLTSINPDFTRSELQMCAFLRMNLPSKEIAGLMNLSVSRVDQTRHQIRKKLSLDQNQNLISFLITMQTDKNGNANHQPSSSSHANN